ncbi:MAG: hypothetical protein ACRDY1_00500 [Acidimicrobiales bacterium]
MSLRRIIGMAVSAGAIVTLGVQALPAAASTTRSSAPKAVLKGVLGYEGGASTKLHPTSGTVSVSFDKLPLVLEVPVGSSGHFHVKLSPGGYEVSGCGPSSNGGQPLCGQAQAVTLKAGEVDHIQVVWAYTP